jgi:hypothetical protein
LVSSACRSNTGIGGGGPNERFRAGLIGEVAGDLGLEVDQGMEHTTLQAAPRKRGDETFNHRNRSEVEGPARMTRQLYANFGVFVGALIVEHHVDQPTSWGVTLKALEKAREFLVTGAEGTLRPRKDDSLPVNIRPKYLIRSPRPVSYACGSALGNLAQASLPAYGETGRLALGGRVV